MLRDTSTYETPLSVLTVLGLGLIPALASAQDEVTIDPVYDDALDEDFAIEPVYDDALDEDFAIEPVYDDALDEDFAIEPAYDDPAETRVDRSGSETVELTEEDDAYWEQLWEELEDPDIDDEITVSEELEAGLGRVVGTVVDDEFEDPIGGCSVAIDELPDVDLTTGPSGTFAVDLVPGVYVLRFSHFAYRTNAYEVEVVEDTPTDLAQVRLTSNEEGEFTLVVEARQDRESVSAQLQSREDARVVSDAISAEQFANAPDSAASDTLRRVVGATVVDGRFLVVRGLGGRYTDATLNGAPIPRTDPTYPGVELDIFSTDLLATLVLYKSFSPELSGAFAGGLVNIRTETYPDERAQRAGLSLSSDLSTLGQDVLTYQGGALDLLGFDDGGRALPSTVPTDGPVIIGDRRDPDGLNPAEIEAIAESFGDSWAVSSTPGRPNVGVGAGIGDTVEVAGTSLGYMLHLDYGTSHERRLGAIRNTDIAGSILDDRARETGSSSTLWGVLGTSTLSLGEGHDMTLLTLFNQSARDQVIRLEGYNEELGATTRSTQLSFVSRSLLMSQLSGSHRRLLPATSPWHETALSWRLGYALAARTEPDTRYLVQTRTDVDTWRWRPNPGSGERFFASLGQRDLSAGLDLTLPHADDLTLTAGGAAVYSDREFAARRFRYTFSGDDPTTRDLPAEELFGTEHVGQDVGFGELTQSSDSYRSTQLVLAGYSGAALEASGHLRLSGGARAESFVQTMAVGSSVVPSDQPDARREDVDILPALSGVYRLQEGMQVRLGYGGTVSRPLVEEVSPFVTQDYVRRQTVQGNTALERTYVHNMDLRWEWFPSAGEVLAASAFGKSFLSPIERVARDQRGQLMGFENADSAVSYGLELEAQVALQRVSPVLSGTSFAVNLMLADSSISLPCTPDTADPNACAEHYTNQERAMAGQSPWVANGRLAYEPSGSRFSAFAFYNVFGPRITAVGLEGRSDTYELPVHALDLSARYHLADHWGLRFSASNLIATPSRQELDGVILEEVARPMSVSLGLSFD